MANRYKNDNQHFLVNHHQRVNLSLHILLIAILGLVTHTSSSAQRIGEEAEMNRLEQQADDLAAQADPEGAALAIGKAAMMADLLIKGSKNFVTKKLLQAASSLYRGQELGLRALALFEQTGGNPPAPSGVCHYLFQGYNKLNDSKNILQEIDSTSSEEIKIRREKLFRKNEEWEDLLLGLHEDFACSHTLNKKYIQSKIP